MSFLRNDLAEEGAGDLEEKFYVTLIITVSYQALRAATLNPVKNLRSE